MNPTFLTVARQGRNGWKYYLYGILTIIGVPLVLILLFTVISAQILGISITGKNQDLIYSGDPVRHILFTGLSGVGLLGGLFLAITRVHRRKFITLFNLDDTVDWLRVVKSFVLWVAIYGISFFALYLIVPSRYSLTFNISEWLPFSLLALVLIPITSLARTLFLYAYLLQAASLWIRNPLLLSIVWGVWGILAGIISNSPSPWMILSAVSWVFTTWIIIKDNRLELAIGLLAANSLISMLLIGSPDDSAKVPSVFTILDDSAHFLPVAATVVLRLGLFYFICFGRRRKLSKSATN